MNKWRGVCQNCYEETSAYTMSMMSTDLICMDCKRKEKKHIRYQEAVEAESKAVASGNLNFKGILDGESK